VSFAQQFLQEVQQVTAQLSPGAIERAVDELARVRERGGRLFILGVGGSAANASHAVNDFRKICGFECYAPTDNVSELTARTNDDGWASVFVEWLKGSRLSGRDGLLIFSVGGGNLEKNVSPNLVSAIQLAQQTGASVVGVVGRDGGYTAKAASACIPGGGLASVGFSPETEDRQDEVGKHTVNGDGPDGRGGKRRAVFLDRDGVINRALERDGRPYPPANLGEFDILPGTAEACNALKAAGFWLVVATNQPDVGRGTLAREVVESIHAFMRQQL
jgi:D-sedoheptulose 7-phosphate isomerase